MTDRESQLRFIESLFLLKPSERAHLLRIEADSALAELLKVALDEQHFEVAADIKNEIKRRNLTPITECDSSRPYELALINGLHALVPNKPGWYLHRSQANPSFPFVLKRVRRKYHFFGPLVMPRGSPLSNSAFQEPDQWRIPKPI